MYLVNERMKVQILVLILRVPDPTPFRPGTWYQAQSFLWVCNFEASHHRVSNLELTPIVPSSCDFRNFIDAVTQIRGTVRLPIRKFNNFKRQMTIMPWTSDLTAQDDTGGDHGLMVGEIASF
jgi:hypothetical protein